MESHWNLRLSTEADLPFILSSWLRGYRQSSVTSGISNTVYYRSHEAALKRLLVDAVVIVACAKDDPNQIFGYVVGEHDGIAALTVHWVYVKQPFRRLGMAAHLLATLRDTPHDVEWHSARTRPSRLFTSKSALNPYALWRHV